MMQCAECGKKALFKIKMRGNIRADKRHDLCFRCSRAHLNRMRGTTPQQAICPDRTPGPSGETGNRLSDAVKPPDKQTAEPKLA